MNYRHHFEGKLRKDYLIYLSGKIIPGLVGFISVPIFVRYFGKATYGEFSIIHNTLLLVVSSVTSWLSQGIIRFYQESEDKDYFLQQITIIGFYLALGTIIIYFILSSLFLMYDMTFNIIISLTVYSAIFFLIYNSILQARLKPKTLVLADNIRSIFFISLPLLLFFFIGPINSLVIGLFVSYFIALLGMVSFNSKKLLNYDFVKYEILISGFETKKIWQYGWPLAIWFLLATLLNVSDRYIIGYYFGFEKVGEYSAIYDINSKVFKFLLTPLLTALFPIIVKLNVEGKLDKIKSLLKKVSYFYLFIFIVFLILLIFVKEIIIREILHFNNLDETVPLVIPIYIGTFLWQYSLIIHKPFELSNKTVYMLYSVLVATFINITLNIIFIPYFGYIVAAYSTIIGSTVYMILVILIQKKVLFSQKDLYKDGAM